MSTRTPGRLKGVVYWVVIVVLGVAIVNLSRGVAGMLKARGRIDQAKEELAALESKKAALEVDLKWKTSEAFVEQEIRNELHMAKPDEVVVMVDEGLYPDLEEEKPAEPVAAEKANWQKWLELFW